MLKSLKTILFPSHFYFRSPVYKKKEPIYTSVHAERASIYIKIPSEYNCPLPIISCKGTQGKLGVCKKSASVQNSAWNPFEVGWRAEVQIWEKVTSSPSSNLCNTLKSLNYPRIMLQSTHFTSPPQYSQLTDLVWVKSSKPVKPSPHGGNVENDTNVLSWSHLDGCTFWCSQLSPQC